MTTPTPRTDEAKQIPEKFDELDYVVHEDFARQLETELAAAVADKETLERQRNIGLKTEMKSMSESKCTLEENIDRAARELPDGWIIEINVEAGAGWVTLYDGCGNCVGVCGDRTINEQVSEAISYAQEHS